MLSRGPRAEDQSAQTIRDAATSDLPHDWVMVGEIIPLGQLLRELILAIGAALVVGNVLVIFKHRRNRQDAARRSPNFKVVTLNIVIGVLLALWGLSSILNS